MYSRAQLCMLPTACALLTHRLAGPPRSWHRQLPGRPRLGPQHRQLQHDRANSHRGSDSGGCGASGGPVHELPSPTPARTRACACTHLSHACSHVHSRAYAPRLAPNLAAPRLQGSLPRRPHLGRRHQRPPLALLPGPYRPAPSWYCLWCDPILLGGCRVPHVVAVFGPVWSGAILLGECHIPILLGECHIPHPTRRVPHTLPY